MAPKSGAPVWVAVSAIQDAPDVLPERPNSLAVLRIRVAVSSPDDHGPDRPRIFARRRKHRGCKSVSLLIPKGEEHRHDALKVGLQPDVPLDVGPGGRDIGRAGVFTRLPKVLLDRVLHEIGLQSRFRLGLDLEPRLPAWSVAYEPHHPVRL